MPVESVDIWVLTVLMFAGVFAVLAAYTLPDKWILAGVILLTPFQPLANPYTSVNVLIGYVLFVTFVLRGKIRHAPALGATLAILLVMLAAVSRTHQATWVYHAIYIFNLAAAFCFFYIAYNLALQVRDARFVCRVLLALNWLVIGYCLIQVVFGGLSVPGLSQWLSMESARVGEFSRLRGPFGAVGLTAEYFVLATLFTAYLLLSGAFRQQRNQLLLLIVANVTLLIMTGNRGGFIVLVVTSAALLLLFRGRLSGKTLLTTVAVSVSVLIAASVIAVKYTEFDSLYTRLGSTTLEEGMPDTRARTWRIAVSEIAERPWLGHGPRLRLTGDWDRDIAGHDPITYPHNLYLFLLYTLGIAGLGAYLWFFGAATMRLVAARQFVARDSFEGGLVTLGLLLMLAIAMDQMKIEFLRFGTMDYVQFVFVLVGVFVAMADMSRISTAREPVGGTSRSAQSVGGHSA